MAVLSIFITVAPVGAISHTFGLSNEVFPNDKICTMIDIALSLGMINHNLHCLLKRYAKVQRVEHLTLIWFLLISFPSFVPCQKVHAAFG